MRGLEERLKKINSIGSSLTAESDEGLARRAGDARSPEERLAALREIAARLVGLRPFDVQMLGAMAVIDGCIAEMKTGEGKTLTAALAGCFLALEGRKVYVVTVNDYLARRDAEWMGPLYRFCGIEVGCVTSDLPPFKRREEYSKRVVYCPNHELAFDYLRDNLARSLDEILLDKLDVAILDEIDLILIDEAQTPLIIAEEVPIETGELFKIKGVAVRMISLQKRRIGEIERKLGSRDLRAIAKLRLADPLNPALNRLFREEPRLKRRVEALESRLRVEGRSTELEEGLLYVLDARNKAARLTEEGEELARTWLPVDDSPRGWRVRRELIQFIRAYELFKRDVDYIVRDGRVVVIDEFTGRAAPDKRFEGGLHAALECKENLPPRPERIVRARITYPSFFSMFKMLAGLTGTARHNAGEFLRLYGLKVIPIPTNKPVIRADLPEIVFETEEGKWEAVIREVKRLHSLGIPVLIGTRSIEASERVSRMLRERGIPHRVLNAKNDAYEAELISKAGHPYAVTVATNMAGRGTDIKLHPDLFRIVTENYLKLFKERLREGRGVRAIVLSGFEREFLREALEREGIAYRETKEGFEIGEGETEEMEYHLGLYVIGTERHESARIDEQLAGRAGRQGDPGASRFFTSMEDELVRLYGGGSPREAQKRAEAAAFAAREAQMRFERAISRFREAFYSLRREILTSEADGWTRRAVEEACRGLKGERVMAEMLLSADEMGRAGKVLAERALSVDPEVRRAVMLEKLDEAWSEFLMRAEEIGLSLSLGPPSPFEPESQLLRELRVEFERLMSWAEKEFVKEISRLSMPRFRRAIFRRADELEGDLRELAFGSAPSRSTRRP